MFVLETCSQKECVKFYELKMLEASELQKAHHMNNTNEDNTHYIAIALPQQLGIYFLHQRTDSAWKEIILNMPFSISDLCSQISISLGLLFFSRAYSCFRLCKMKQVICLKTTNKPWYLLKTHQKNIIAQEGTNLHPKQSQKIHWQDQIFQHSHSLSQSL